MISGVAASLGLVVACTGDSSRPGLGLGGGGEDGGTCQGATCASCTTPGGCATDGGGQPVDSGGPVDAGPPPDGATACTPHHLPPGFTVAVASQAAVDVETGSPGNRTYAMALDENDDPLMVYATQDSSTAMSIHFVRWDACAGQFTAPIVVDALHVGELPDVSIAYDPTTKEIGIAYVRPSTLDAWNDAYGAIWLATMKAPATTFSLQPLTVGIPDYLAAYDPAIAMGGGRIYVAYWQGPYPSPDTNHSALAWLLSSTTTPGEPPLSAPESAPDGSVGDAAPAPWDASAEDAGPPPAHYFSYEAVPYAAGTSSAAGGFVCAQQSSGAMSVAIDSNGVPAVALYQGDPTASKQLLFWRAGTPGAVLVHPFALDGDPDVALAFEGTKPRIVGHMDLPTFPDASALEPDSLRFFASDDGVSWSPGINLPNNDESQNTAPPVALALDGMGHAAVVADINGGLGNGMSCGSNPYVATSSDEDDGGARWTACGADTTDAYAFTVSSVNAFYGASRLKGTLTVSFVSSGGNVADGGTYPAGIVYWQHP